MYTRLIQLPQKSLQHHNHFFPRKAPNYEQIHIACDYGHMAQRIFQTFIWPARNVTPFVDQATPEFDLGKKVTRTFTPYHFGNTINENLPLKKDSSNPFLPP